MTLLRRLLPPAFSAAFMAANVFVLCCTFFGTGETVADESATRDRRHRQLLERRQVVYDELQNDLETVAAWCMEHALPDAIAEINELRPTLLKPAVESNPPRLVTPDVDKSLSLEEQQWRLQIRHHRQERAAELYTLARSALRAKFPSLAPPTLAAPSSNPIVRATLAARA